MPFLPMGEKVEEIILALFFFFSCLAHKMIEAAWTRFSIFLLNLFLFVQELYTYYA